MNRIIEIIIIIIIIKLKKTCNLSDFYAFSKSYPKIVNLS